MEKQKREYYIHLLITGLEQTITLIMLIVEARFIKLDNDILLVKAHLQEAVKILKEKLDE